LQQDALLAAKRKAREAKKKQKLRELEKVQQKEMSDKEIELNNNKFNKEMESIEEKMDEQLDDQI
jgi:hypothetical protein